MYMKLWELLSPPAAQLNELLDQPLDWEWIVQREIGSIAEFYSDGDLIEVTFDKGNSITDIMFVSKEHGIDLSGDGNQFKILSTVVAIARDFLSSNPPEVIRFSAKGTSRIRLYRRFAEMIARELNWKVEEKETSSDKIFYIKPKNHVNEDGMIIPNVNTTVDVQPGETERQSAKFGNNLDSKGRPPLLRGNYGDDSARFSANQGDPYYGSNGTRLKENQINELLSNPVSWKWTEKSYSQYRASFNTKKSKIYVSFSGEDSVSITFYNDSHGGDLIGITNSGDQYEVFSTMVDIIRSFVEDRSPQKIHFTARDSEPSRIKLYDRICSSLKLPGYEFSKSGKLIYRFIKRDDYGLK